MRERKRESCSESKSLIIEKEAKRTYKQKDMLKQRKNTYSLHDYTNDLFATYSFIFEITFILLDFFSETLSFA